MQRINILFFIIIHFLSLFDNTKQSHVKQALTTLKTIDKTIKIQLWKRFGNTIKNSLKMFRGNKNTIKNFACGFKENYLKTRHNFRNKHIKYLGEKTIKNFKYTTPLSARVANKLVITESKKNLQMRSADAQLPKKEFRHLINKSAEYIRGKELISYVNLVSKNKLQFPLFFGTGGLNKLTQFNLVESNNDTEQNDTSLNDGIFIEQQKIKTKEQKAMTKDEYHKAIKVNKLKEDYYQKNKEKILLKQKKYYQENKDKIRKNTKEYKLKNKERILLKQKEYYKENKDKIAKINKEYNIRNKEKCAQAKRKYYQKNREKIIEKNIEYNKNNPEKCLAALRKYSKTHKAKIAERSRAYNMRNKELISIRNKSYNLANKEKIALHQKNYLIKNKEKILERRREYYKINKHRIISRSKEYIANNKAKVAEQQKKYKQDNELKLAKYAKEHYAKNRGKIGARQKAYRIERKLNEKTRKEMFGDQKSDKEIPNYDKYSDKEKELQWMNEACDFE